MAKQIFYILLTALLVFSCKKEETQSILGKWKLEKVYADNPTAEKGWFDVENGMTYEIYSGDSIASSRFSCMGNYKLNSDTITINFSCPTTYFQMSYTYSIEKGKLILKAENQDCDQGCGEMYKRLE